MEAQLRDLESRILVHVAEMQGKSAREAVASLGLTLQREGVIGVTEEVRTLFLDPPHTQCSPPGSHRAAVPPSQLPGRFQDLSNIQKPPMFVLGLV